MLHLKDIRKGAETGSYTGAAPATDDVPVGTGQVDWPAVLKEARSLGVTYAFIEDESPEPLKNIPLSLQYLKDLLAVRDAPGAGTGFWPVSLNILLADRGLRSFPNVPSIGARPNRPL